MRVGTILNIYYMKNLEHFEEFKLDDQSLIKIKGGGWKNRIIDILVHELWEWSKENLLTQESMEEYGRRMYETGSPGGHK